MCRSFDFACACIVVLMHVFVPYLSTRAQGGGLYIEGSTITIADSHIHDNTAVSVVLAYLACIVVLIHVFVPPALAAPAAVLGIYGSSGGECAARLISRALLSSF